MESHTRLSLKLQHAATLPTGSAHAHTSCSPRQPVVSWVPSSSRTAPLGCPATQSYTTWNLGFERLNQSIKTPKFLRHGRLWEVLHEYLGGGC